MSCSWMLRQRIYNLEQSQKNEPQNNTDNEVIVKNVPQNVPQNKASLRRISLIDEIIANPTISKEELAKKFGVTTMTIKRDLIKLRETYTIEWQGPARGGRWCVKKR